MAVKVRIGSIDMDGYWGRSPHPEKEDSGTTATLLSFQPDQEDTDIFTVRMEDGRIIELVLHEVESLELDYSNGADQNLTADDFRNFGQ
jgi:hypothetical protein